MGFYLGLMSGTSMDAIDAALVDFNVSPLRIIATSATAFDLELKRRIANILDSADGVPLDEVGQIDVELARAFSQAALTLVRDAGLSTGRVTAIGSHGQTLRHCPDLPTPFTWQIGDPNTLTELTGITVVADFRSRDIAAGGQGAPLLPVFHAGIFTTDSPRAVVNIGGIANVTGLPAAGSGEPVIGFDCGPGNVLIDAWAAEHLGDRFDRDGHWAAGGHSDAAWLQALLAEPYFSAPPPKSTGRELFNRQWLSHKLAQRELAPRDVQATLTRLTAASIGQAIAQHVAPAVDVLVCGGGAFNATLMRMLGEECAPRPVASTAALGVAPDHVEAFAFAWLAREHVHGRAVSLPAVTGARGPRVLGALYPAG